MACCHTAQAPHPPDSDLTCCMRTARPWAAASPVLRAAGTYCRATPPERRPERHLLRALPWHGLLRSAAACYCAAWEGSFEDRSSTLPVIRVYISSTSSTVVSKCEVASYLRMHRRQLRPSRSPKVSHSSNLESSSHTCTPSAASRAQERPHLGQYSIYINRLYILKCSRSLSSRGLWLPCANISC